MPEFNPFPRYLQIRALLLRRMQSDYAPGDRFPTENALCEEFGVSRETIRDALAGLEEQGLIARSRGTGTTVLRHAPVGANQRLTGLVENFTEMRLDTHTSLLGKEICSASAHVAKELLLDDAQEAFVIRRLRFLDGTPLAIHEAYLPRDYEGLFVDLDLSHGTVLNSLRANLRDPLVEDYQEFDACGADPSAARLLDVSISFPLLEIRRRYLNGSGRPLVFFRSWFRSDRYYTTLKLPVPEAHGTMPGHRPYAAAGSSAEFGRMSDVVRHLETTPQEGVPRASGAAARNLEALAAARSDIPLGATPLDFAALFQTTPPLGAER